MNIRELAKHDDFIARYRHKTKGGFYTVVSTAVAAGELKDVSRSLIVYRNELGDVFVRRMGCFNDNMELIV